MESIIGKLARISISCEESLDRLLAKKILKNFSDGIFSSQKLLATELFISESVITKFCKKIGYSGFRQFNEFLRIEYQKYQLDRSKTISDQKIINDMLKTSLEDVNQNQHFISKLRTAVYDKKTLTIFPSYQAEDAGVFLRDYLVDKNINAKTWNPAKNFIININDYLDKDEPILFIFTGPDNYQNYSFFEELKKGNSHELFAITTSGQENKVNLENKYVIKSNIKYSNTFVREVLMELIFLETFE